MASLFIDELDGRTLTAEERDWAESPEADRLTWDYEKNDL